MDAKPAVPCLLIERNIMGKKPHRKLTWYEMIVLWGGIGTVVLMCLIPPWYYQSPLWNAQFYSHDAGYSVIFHPPGGGPWESSIRLDIGRLALQCGVVALLTAAILFTMRQARKRKES